MDEGDNEMGKGVDREMVTLIEESRYGDREEWDEGERMMEGNRKDKEVREGEL